MADGGPARRVADWRSDYLWKVFRRCDLRLESIGPKRLKVLSEVRRLVGGDFRQAKTLVDSVPCLILERVRLQDAEPAQQALLAAGARAAIILAPLLFPRGAFSDLALLDAYDNQTWSQILADLGEPLLPEWVRDNGIEEGYRGILRESFGPCTVVRLWRTPNGNRQICGVQLLDYRQRVMKISTFDLSEDAWNALQATLARTRFWRGGHSWRPEGRGQLDGWTWLFEGWRDGHYKLIEYQRGDLGPGAELARCIGNIAPESSRQSIGIMYADNPYLGPQPPSRPRTQRYVSSSTGHGFAAEAERDDHEAE